MSWIRGYSVGKKWMQSVRSTASLSQIQLQSINSQPKSKYIRISESSPLGEIASMLTLWRCLKQFLFLGCVPLIIIDQSRLNLILIIFVGRSKEIQMKQHSLADCLLQLRGKLQLEGNSTQTLLILDIIHSRLIRQLQSHQALQMALQQKQSQLKANAGKFKKVSQQLNRKSQLCQGLQQELTRVKAIYREKVELFTARTGGVTQTQTKQEVVNKGSVKKSKTTSSGTQCEIIQPSCVEELSAHNYILKNRLEETQKILVQEHQHKEVLTAEIQQLKTEVEGLQNQLIKDNSTDDAGSLKGDLFELEDNPEFAQTTQPEMGNSHLADQSVFSRLWEYGERIYRKMSSRY